MYTAGISTSTAFGGYGTGGWLHFTREEQWAVLYAQNFMLICLVWYLGKFMQMRYFFPPTHSTPVYL